jgi:FkbM family methyltransferase
MYILGVRLLHTLNKLVDLMIFSRRTKPWLFVTIFNMRSFFWSRMSENHKVRIKQNSEKSGFLVLSQVANRHANNKDLVNHVYKRGVINRGLDLGHAYHLNRISFSPGDLIVDCGANLGDLKLYFDYINAGIEYIAFEPSKTEYVCLEKNSQPSTCYNLGLWNCNTTLEFFQSSANGDSSFIPSQKVEDVYRIDVVRLDEIISRDVKLLKLEAEGAEPEVIMGCENLLEKIEYIAADLGPERGLGGENTVPFVVNYLLSRNFEVLHFTENRCIFLFQNTRLRKAKQIDENNTVSGL